MAIQVGRPFRKIRFSMIANIGAFGIDDHFRTATARKRY
jgi:hypothetical protein